MDEEKDKIIVEWFLIIFLACLSLQFYIDDKKKKTANKN
jgi:hypothetical protein